MITSQIGIKLSLDGAAAVTSGLAGVQNSLGSLAGRVETVRSALAGFAPALASAFTVGGLVAFVRNTTQAIDAMNDLADATGSSVESISKIDQVARRTGATLDTAGAILVKFNSALKEADGKNGVSIALQAIGVEAAKLRQLDPAEALRQAAVALNGFADDGNKARIVQELFGKSVREAAPFLKDLAEAGELNASVTAQQAAEAEKFNKQLFAFQANASDAARSIMSSLLPTISEVLKGFEGSADGATRFSTAVDAVRVPLEALAVFGANVAFVFKGVGRELGAVAAQLTALSQGNMAGFRAIGEAVRDDAKRAREELEAYEKRVLNARNAAATGAGAGLGNVNPPAAVTAPGLIDIAAEQARRKAAEEAAAALLKQREAYDKLRISIEERISAGQLELTQGQALTEAQRLKIKLDQDYASGLLKLTPAQKAVVDSKVAELAATEALVKADQEALKAAKAEAEARAQARRAEDRAIAEFLAAESARARASLASVKDRITSLQNEAKASELAANMNISLAEALELVTIARLEEKKAQYQEGSEAYAAVQLEIDARKELADLIGSSAAREANRRAAEDAARDWQRTADQIGQSLSDALMQGGKSAWEYIKGLFRSMVLRPVIQAIVNPVVGTVGSALGLASGTAAASGAAGAASSGMAAGGLAAMFSGFTGSVTSGLQMALAGNAGAAFGVAKSSLAAGSTASGLGVGIGAAMPYALAAVAALNALGVFRSRSIVGGGLIGTLGMGNIESYDLQRRGGTLFSGPSYSLVNRAASPESAAIQSAFDALRTNAASMAEALGLSSTAVKTFTTTLGTDIVQNDIGVRGIKLDGLTAEQAAQKVQEALNSANEQLAAFVLGLDGTSGALGRTGETSVQTLTRLASSIAAINPVLETLNLKLYDTSLTGADLASQLADAFGGLEAFQQQSSAYYQEFFSEAERAANTTEQLTKALGGLGLALPTTREQFRALVEAQDLSTEAGRKAFATLVGLSGTFAQLVPAVQAVEEAATGATQALRSAADILREREGLERQLLQLQGDTTALRALDRAALDESNRALYDRIIALQDSQAAEAAAVDILRERQGLERQLLQLQGDTTALRALDRAALDESNRALYDRIIALQDSQAAEAAAAEATRVAAAQAQAIAQQRDSLLQQLYTLRGDTATLRERERAALDASNRALFDHINALRDMASASEAAAQALREAAQARQRDADTARSGTDAALAAVRSAVQAQTAAAEAQLTAAYDLLIEGIERQKLAATATRQAAQETLQAARGIFEYLGDQIDQLRGTAGAGMTSAQGRAAIQSAVAVARATGALPDQDSLAKAVAAARGGLDSSRFVTSVDQRRATLLLAQDLADLQEVAGTQATVAEQALQVAEDQLAALESAAEQAEKQHRASLAALQESSAQQIAAAQAQVDELRGVNNSVLSVSASLQALAAALRTERTAVAAAATAQAAAATATGTAAPAAQSSAAAAAPVKRTMANLPADWATRSPARKIDWFNDQKITVAELTAAGVSWEEIQWMMNQPNGYKGFASGGMHMGGLRLVGERGPELEVTGPARIFSYEQTRDMLGGGQRREEALVAEIRGLRAELEGLRAETRATAVNTNKTARILERVTPDGASLQTVAAP